MASGSRKRSESGLEIRVDHGLCSGSGYCAQVCPEAFEVRGVKSWVRPADRWQALPREKLQAACDSCPWDAIALTEGEGP